MSVADMKLADEQAVDLVHPEVWTVAFATASLNWLFLPAIKDLTVLRVMDPCALMELRFGSLRRSFLASKLGNGSCLCPCRCAFYVPVIDRVR